jgi:hypothetical protein
MTMLPLYVMLDGIRWVRRGSTTRRVVEMHTSLEPPTMRCGSICDCDCVCVLCAVTRGCVRLVRRSVRRRCSASCSVTAITNCTAVTEQRRINRPPLPKALRPRRRPQLLRGARSEVRPRLHRPVAVPNATRTRTWDVLRGVAPRTRPLLGVSGRSSGG